MVHPASLLLFFTVAILSMSNAKNVTAEDPSWTLTNDSKLTSTSFQANDNLCSPDFLGMEIGVQANSPVTLTFTGSEYRLIGDIVPRSPVSGSMIITTQLDDQPATNITLSKIGTAFACATLAREFIDGPVSEHKLRIQHTDIRAYMIIAGASIVSPDDTSSQTISQGPAGTISHTDTTSQSSTPSQSGPASYSDTLPSNSGTTSTNATPSGTPIPQAIKNTALSTGGIVGITIGLAVIFIALAFVLLHLWCRSRAKSEKHITAVSPSSGTDERSSSTVSSEKLRTYLHATGEKDLPPRPLSIPDPASVQQQQRSTKGMRWGSQRHRSAGPSTSQPQDPNAVPPEIEELYGAMNQAGFTTQSFFDRIRRLGGRNNAQGPVQGGEEQLPRYT